jgi:hypothetical protein
MIRQSSRIHGVWTDVDVQLLHRRIVLRMYGDDTEVLKIARSLRRGHP